MSWLSAPLGLVNDPSKLCRVKGVAELARPAVARRFLELIGGESPQSYCLGEFAGTEGTAVRTRSAVVSRFERSVGSMARAGSAHLIELAGAVGASNFTELARAKSGMGSSSPRQ